MRYSIFCTFMALTFSSSAWASEARSYQNMPLNSSILETRIGQTINNMTLPSGLEVQAHNNYTAERYLQYFSLNGHTSAFYVMTPHFQQYQEAPSLHMRQDSNGVGDTIFALAYGIKGMNAMDMATFKTANHNGVNSSCGLFVTAPTGSYDKTQALNAGANRWQEKIECNVGYTNNGWVHEMNLGTIHYGDNTEYQNNKTLQQDNLYFAEWHSSKNVLPVLWLGVDAYYTKGGERTINGVAQQDKQNNLALGVSAGLRLASNQSLRLTAQKTVDKPQYALKSQSITALYAYLF